MTVLPGSRGPRVSGLLGPSSPGPQQTSGLVTGLGLTEAA